MTSIKPYDAAMTGRAVPCTICHRLWLLNRQQTSASDTCCLHVDWLGLAGSRRKMAPSGTDASAHSVGRVARSIRNVGQPDYVLTNSITGHKAKRGSRPHKEWLAVTKNNGVEVDPILIDKIEVAQARQIRSANVNLPNALILQPAHRLREITLDKCGVRTD